jgi:hypothetical protein
MSEVGLVPFARVALEVCEEVLPAYSHPFSPQRFTQPQLLAILCLMRYQDWTFRATEVRLAEHGELRRALGLKVVPDYSTLYRFMLRVKERVIREALAEVVRRLQRRRSGPRPEGATVAVDATGLNPGSISTYFIRRREEHGGGPMPRRYWLKWLLAVDTRLRVILAQKAHAGPANDCATLRPLLDEVKQNNSIVTVLADAEFDTESNHRHIREQLGAESIIPAKRSPAHWKLRGFRGQMRVAFPAQRYRERAQAESLFSAIKRKLSARAPGRSIATQRKQALLLGLAYNLYRLWPPLALVRSRSS